MHAIPVDFYKALEDRFRGSRETIAGRLAVYRPLLAAHFPQPQAGPLRAIDIGCGRGEWLELLTQAGWSCKGVDTDARMLEYCRGLGFDVEGVDAIDYLASLPQASVALVTGFHIVEHLPTGSVIELLRQVRRVLMPDGLAILETPNPENLMVGAHLFYLDPTHERPVPPLLLQFMGEFAGFGTSEILRLHPAAASPLEPQDKVGMHLGPFFWGPHDYALLAAPSAAAAQTIRDFVAGVDNAATDAPQAAANEESQADTAAAQQTSVFPLNRFLKRILTPSSRT
ncbi:MAG: class I SAM-dependent methyltransferase [Aquabacterium sp.]|nr:MAG: class I SAM-dependent methyltransferase [Aquabacterium sp.]